MVRIRSPGKYVARPAWYDRTPINRVNSWQATGIGPHAETERLTYTCPAGKKAMVEVLQASLERKTAPTTGERAWAYWYYTPSGAGGYILIVAVNEGIVVGDGDNLGIGGAILLKAGDVLSGRTWDTATGGTYDYHLSYKITEFDA